MVDQPDREAAVLYQDELSFKQPLADAYSDCCRALDAAARKVSGSEDRVATVLYDLADLKAFDRNVEKHLRAGTFHTLPGITFKGTRLEHCHQLTVGPWRGVFLVDPGGGQVVALLFSKEPHSLDERLGELAAAHETRQERSK